jgi:hypothetical protein
MKEPISAPISLRWDYDPLNKSGLQNEEIPPSHGGIFFSEFVIYKQKGILG